MKNYKKIGNKVLVSEASRTAAINMAKEINSSAVTGKGTSSIDNILDKSLRDLMKDLSNRIVDKSSGIIRVDKLSDILKVEESFADEVIKTPEMSLTANLKPSLRYTYVKSLLSKYGRPTINDVKNILSQMNLEGKNPGSDDTKELAEISTITGKDEIYAAYVSEREVRIGKNAGGKPSVLINTACDNLNKVFTKKHIDAEVIAKPKKRDYTKRGLNKPYKGLKAADMLLVISDGSSKKCYSLEYYGWSGVSYERNMLQKNIEVAEDFGHQYGIFSPNHADNPVAANTYANEIFDREFVEEENSVIEAAAYRWVMTNDKYTGISTEDAIYNGIYGILEEAGIARKTMPASKLKLFAR